MLPREHCEKCGYTWIKRIDGKPKQCPACKNVKYWEPRTKGVKKDGERKVD